MGLRCLIADDDPPIHTGAVCIWCAGRGRIERYVRHLRRRTLVTCKRCDGTGRELQR